MFYYIISSREWQEENETVKRRVATYQRTRDLYLRQGFKAEESLTPKKLLAPKRSSERHASFFSGIWLNETIKG